MSNFFPSILSIVLFFSVTQCSWKKEQSLDIGDQAQKTEKSFVIIVPSYNNKRWYKRNLDSIFLQKCQNFRVIYIDDASTDGTAQLVEQYCTELRWQDKITIVANTQRVGALANIYKAVQSCADDEVVILVDGDDWLFDDTVFAYINNIYQDESVWITWGQFVEYPSRQKGFAADFPPEVVHNNSYRQHGMPVTHLRTFYAWLFKLIRKDDLLYNGECYPMTWDKAMMAPMIEMAGGRYKFVDDILYVYNHANPINDCKVNGELQVDLREEIYTKRPYEPLERPIKTGICMPLP